MTAAAIPLHWAAQYIGRPWVSGAQGPDAFDCWGLVRYVQRLYFERELPAVDVDALNIREVARALLHHDERERWMAAETPREGDCALMAHARYPSHVGVWLDVDGGGVLHALQGAGVVFSPPRSLRGVGFGRIEYYRFRGSVCGR